MVINEHLTTSSISLDEAYPAISHFVYNSRGKIELGKQPIDPWWIEVSATDSRNRESTILGLTEQIEIDEALKKIDETLRQYIEQRGGRVAPPKGPFRFSRAYPKLTNWCKAKKRCRWLMVGCDDPDTDGPYAKALIGNDEMVCASSGKKQRNLDEELRALEMRLL